MVDYALLAEQKILQQAQEGMYDASDPKAINDAVVKAARERKAELNYINHILSTKQGRKWLCKLIALGDPLVTPYGFNNTVEHTHVNIGRKEIPAKLLLDIREANPAMYVKLLIEGLNGEYT